MLGFEGAEVMKAALARRAARSCIKEGAASHCAGRPFRAHYFYVQARARPTPTDELGLGCQSTAGRVSAVRGSGGSQGGREEGLQRDCHPLQVRGHGRRRQ